MAGMVKYRVLKKAFINGALLDPAFATGPLYVDAPPGLESDALQLAPDAGAPSLLGGDAALKPVMLDDGFTKAPLTAAGEASTAEVDALKRQIEMMAASKEEIAKRMAEALDGQAKAEARASDAEARLAAAIQALAAAEARANGAEALLAAATQPPAPAPEPVPVVASGDNTAAPANGGKAKK